MIFQNRPRPLRSNYDLLYKQRLAGGGRPVIKWLKSFFGVTALHESKAMRLQSIENINETKKMLTLDGESEWMLNLCRAPKNGTKECLPNGKPITKSDYK